MRGGAEGRGLPKDTGLSLPECLSIQKDFASKPPVKRFNMADGGAVLKNAGSAPVKGRRRRGGTDQGVQRGVLQAHHF